MRILSGKLCVFFLLINFFCFPSAQHATASITNSRIVLAGSVTPLDPSRATPPSQEFKVLARWDIYEIIFGTLLSLVGLALIVLSFLRWKSSIRRQLQIQIAFSIIAIAVSGYLHDPAAAWAANNIIVIIGIVVVLANMFQPNLLWNRELKVILSQPDIFSLILKKKI